MPLSFHTLVTYWCLIYAICFPIKYIICCVLTLKFSLFSALILCLVGGGFASNHDNLLSGAGGPHIERVGVRKSAIALELLRLTFVAGE